MQRLGETNQFKDRNLRLKGADIATQRGWTGVPNFILESDKISIVAKCFEDVQGRDATTLF